VSAFGVETGRSSAPLGCASARAVPSTEFRSPAGPRPATSAFADASIPFVPILESVVLYLIAAIIVALLAF